MDDCRSKFDNDTVKYGCTDRESLLRRHSKGSVAAYALTGICRRLSTRALGASGSFMGTVYELAHPDERAPVGTGKWASVHGKPAQLKVRSIYRAHSARIK